MLHFRRDAGQIAATLDQSAMAISYLDSFMNIPELEPYKDTDNVRIKRFINLPANSYTTKPDAKIQIITATKKGANSPRASFTIYDEVDLTPKEILSESAYIGDVTRDGHRFGPVFVYLSSRKTNDGPIQELIDESKKPKKKKRIRLHKWNAADYMERCPDEVHKPELDRIRAFLHEESLETIWGEENFGAVQESMKNQYREIQAFEGCKECPAWIACQGFSTKQRCTSDMLRDRNFVADILDAVGDAQVIIAQSLNWKPEVTGIVFKTFSYHKHVKDPRDFYEWVAGVPFDPDQVGPTELKRIEAEGTYAEVARITPTKNHIYLAMCNNGWTIGAGCDWGFSPDPALVMVAGYHKRLGRVAILHIEAALNYANHVWADYIVESVYPVFPFEYIGPDTADPASPTYFTKHKIVALPKKPARIETGVSQIRGLLWNPQQQTVNFAVLDDSQMEDNNKLLIEAMQHWTHKKNALGRYDQRKFEDNKWTHAPDTLRYLLHPFVEAKSIGVSAGQKVPETHLVDGIAMKDPDAIKAMEQKQQLQKQMADHFAQEYGLTNVFVKPPENRVQTMEDIKKSRKVKKSTGVRFKF
jgi:hypothetical protein